jgi:hypothetical protein
MNSAVMALVPYLIFDIAEGGAFNSRAKCASLCISSSRLILSSNLFSGKSLFFTILLLLIFWWLAFA